MIGLEWVSQLLKKCHFFIFLFGFHLNDHTPGSVGVTLQNETDSLNLLAIFHFRDSDTAEAFQFCLLCLCFVASCCGRYCLFLSMLSK